MVHADLERVMGWRNHPDVRRYMYTQHIIDLDEHQRWFECKLQDPRNHLLIFEVDQQPFGFVNFTQTGNGGIADWGFYLAPDAPKGSGLQLGLVSLSQAFTKLNFHKIRGEALAYNNRSILFHQALGFHQEGTLRDEHFDGERYHNVICFGLLSHEWHPSI